MPNKKTALIVSSAKTGKGVRYPPAILGLARDMYVRGSTYSQIATKIYDMIGRRPTAAMLSKWCKQYGWEEQKVEAISRALLANDDGNIKLISKDINDQKNAYRTVRERGMEELQGSGVKSAGEAAEMIDRAIKGERMIDAGVIEVRFIEHVVHVIKEETEAIMQDHPEILQKIAFRLKQYVAEQMSGAMT